MALIKTKGQRIEQRTLRTKLVRDGFDFALTNELFSDVVAFYLVVIEQDPGGTLPGADEKRYYEPRFTENPGSWPFDVPQIFRRAALRKAVGMYKSWRSNYENWVFLQEKNSLKKKPLKKAKPPVLPTSMKLNASLYSGMFKEDDGESIMLKLWNGSAWKWIKFQYKSAPPIEGWSKATPSLVVKRDGTAWLNWVYERYQPATGGLKTVMQDGGRFCSVDTDLDGEIMKVCAYDSDADGEIHEIARMTTTGHAAHTSRRKSRLGKQAKRMRKHNAIELPEGFGKTHWDKITRCEREVARQIASQVVAFAAKHGCVAIVFEALKNLTPSREKYSRRANKKRAYWLKSAVRRQIERVARQNHNILSAMVSPWNTSNREAFTGEPVMRTNNQWMAEAMKNDPLFWDLYKERSGYHPGSLAITRSGKVINSGYNACRNIALKFAARYSSENKARLEINGSAGMVYTRPAKVSPS